MKKLVSVFLVPILVALMLSQGNAEASTSVAMKDAEKQGQVLSKLLTEFNSAIDSGNIYYLDFLFDNFSAQIKKTERAIGKVSGASNRKALNEKYVRSAKVARERVIYEISQLRLIAKINDLIWDGEYSKAESDLAKLDRLKRRGVEIKKTGGYAALPQDIMFSLVDEEDWVRYNLIVYPVRNTLGKIEDAINVGDGSQAIGSVMPDSPSFNEIMEFITELANTEWFVYCEVVDFKKISNNEIEVLSYQYYYAEDQYGDYTDGGVLGVVYHMKKINGKWMVFDILDIYELED